MNKEKAISGQPSKNGWPLLYRCRDDTALIASMATQLSQPQQRKRDVHQSVGDQDRLFVFNLEDDVD